MDIGCAQASTAKQDLARQLDALAAVGISKDHIFVDKKLGAHPGSAGPHSQGRSEYGPRPYSEKDGSLSPDFVGVWSQAAFGARQASSSLPMLR